MPSFNDMKKRYTSESTTIGQILKENSDTLMQLTFDNDVNTRQCYIYDYFHDDNRDSCYGYEPSLSLTKTPVKLKFIITNYKTFGKDDPEAHIMFEPDVLNNFKYIPDYFDDMYGQYGIEAPVGLYVDIPNDRGIYHKWFVCYAESANQNPKFGVVKCNYQFEWVEDDGLNRYIRKQWGFERAKGNYNAKSRRGDKVLEMDDQEKFVLPWNKYSMKIRHDDRFIISMLQPKPFAYRVIKVNNTAPKGIIEFTLKQDEFDGEKDLVNLETGDMIPNYYTTIIEPSLGNDKNNDTTIPTDKKAEIVSTSYNVGVGYNKNMQVNIEGYDEVDPQNIEWKIFIKDYDDEESDEDGYMDITNNDYFIIQDTIIQHDKELNFTLINHEDDYEEFYNEDYVGYILRVECTYKDLIVSREFNIV